MESKWYPNLPYNNLFPILFEKEKKRIQKHIKKIKIEHIGSTSVPNLGGKGYIDLIATCPKDKMRDVKEILIRKLGYKYKKDVSIKNQRLFFIKIAPSEYSEKTHYHLHLTYSESKDFKKALAFKKFLIKNPKYLIKYSKLKTKASKEAQKAKNRKEARKIYKKIKDPLIEEILSKIKLD